MNDKNTFQEELLVDSTGSAEDDNIKTDSKTEVVKSKDKEKYIDFDKVDIREINIRNVTDSPNLEIVDKYAAQPIIVEKNKLKDEQIFTRWNRYLLFSLIIGITLSVNMDHGTIPAATIEIQRDLVITEEELGLFGSLVYLGNLIGSVVSISIINKYNRKLLIIIYVILNGFGLWLFTASSNVFFLYVNRIGVGMVQVK